MLQCFGGSGQLHHKQEVPIKEEILTYVSTLPFGKATDGLWYLSFSTNLIFFQDLPSLCPAPGKSQQVAHLYKTQQKPGPLIRLWESLEFVNSYKKRITITYLTTNQKTNLEPQQALLP